MRTITVDQFHAELKAQGVSGREHLAFRCPICGTVQSAQSLIAAGAGKDLDAVEQFLAFSCVGRWTGRGGHKEGDAPGLGCDWTLGGLFRLHTLEIEHGGTKFARFEVATPEEAQALQANHLAQAAA